MVMNARHARAGHGPDSRMNRRFRRFVAATTVVPAVLGTLAWGCLTEWGRDLDLPSVGGITDVRAVAWDGSALNTWDAAAHEWLAQGRDADGHDESFGFALRGVVRHPNLLPEGTRVTIWMYSVPLRSHFTMPALSGPDELRDAAGHTMFTISYPESGDRIVLTRTGMHLNGSGPYEFEIATDPAEPAKVLNAESWTLNVSDYTVANRRVMVVNSHLSEPVEN